MKAHILTVLAGIALGVATAAAAYATAMLVNGVR